MKEGLMNFAFLCLAFCIGTAIPIQTATNGQLAASLGNNPVVAALVSFVVGAVVLTVAAAARGGLPEALAALPSQQPWKFVGGFLGAGFIFSTVFLGPRIGLINLLVLIIAGQLVASMVIDQFGLINMAVRKVSSIRLVGAAIMLAGVGLVLFGDRISAAVGR
jgi:transporter family-2 protein